MTSADHPPRREPASSWAALVAVLVAAFMDYLDASITTAAVPALARDLDASDAETQWMVAGYTLPFALMLVTGGRLGDLYGRKRVFLVGIGGFVVSSLVAGAATTPGTLVGGRVLQGLSAAVMVPQVFTFIQVLFPPRRRGAAFSAFAGVTAIASVAGAPVGGLLIDADPFGLGWRAIFLINVPIGAVTLLAVSVLLPESRADAAAGLDLAGFAVVTVGLSLLVVPLVEGVAAGWPVWTVVAIVTGVGVLAVLGPVERRVTAAGRTPLVPTTLFTQRSFVVGLGMTLLFFAGVNSFFFLFFIYLQEGFGLSTLTASLIVVVWPLAIAVTARATSRRGETRGPALLTVGCVIMAAATAGTSAVVSAAGSDLAGWQVVPTLFATGVGMGLVAPILLDVVLSRVRDTDAGAASGVLASTIQLGASLGVAVAGVLFFALLSHASGLVGAATTVAARLSPPARATAFTDAIAPTLWFHAGAYLLTGLLSLALPARPGWSRPA